MGGEPLLNPNCKDYFAIMRKHFPNVLIWHFASKAKSRVLGILQRKYHRNTPNKVSHKDRLGRNTENLQRTRCGFKVFMDSDKKQKVMAKMILNPKGNSNPFQSFIGCTLNQCAQLYEGKLYPCTFTAYIEHFNKHFSQNLQITSLDFIDIHKPNLAYQEILNFMAKPLPFCRYCDTMKWQHIGEWKDSKKDISEYLE